MAASTPNVLIYATSNRRHLLPEYMKDNLTYKLGDDGGPARPLPSECPFAVRDLVQRLPDIDALLARVAGASGPPAKG